MKMTCYILFTTPGGQYGASLVIEGEHNGHRAIGVLNASRKFDTPQEATTFVREKAAIDFSKLFEWGDPTIEEDPEYQSPWLQQAIERSGDLRRLEFRRELLNGKPLL